MSSVLTVTDAGQLAESWQLALRAERKSPQTLKTYGDGLRFQLRDRKGSAPERITVLYKGSLSDQFRENREVSVKGELRNGIFVARKDSLVTKCPSKFTAKT